MLESMIKKLTAAVEQNNELLAESNRLMGQTDIVANDTPEVAVQEQTAQPAQPAQQPVTVTPDPMAATKQAVTDKLEEVVQGQGQPATNPAPFPDGGIIPAAQQPAPVQAPPVQATQSPIPAGVTAPQAQVAPTTTNPDLSAMVMTAAQNSGDPMFTVKLFSRHNVKSLQDVTAEQTAAIIAELSA